MLSIAAFKQNLQKIIFPIFPKTGSGTCPGSPGGTPQVWSVCPQSIIFWSFLPSSPGDQFWPILHKMYFCKFRKKVQNVNNRGILTKFTKKPKIPKNTIFANFSDFDQKCVPDKKTRKVRSQGICAPRDKKPKTRKKKNLHFPL